MTARPIEELAGECGVPQEQLLPFGRGIAKLSLAAVRSLAQKPRGKLVLVSAMSPTPHGEGKTTVAIGLAQGLRRLGVRPVLSLRQPSLGPVFGAKGGATGGGRATLEPASRINLHFTGDLHAVGAAHNLLCALVGDALHFRTEVELDARRITWRRALDMNDRSLRHIVVGLGGEHHGVLREDGFDITAASEVMAVLSLAGDVPELKARLGRMLVGFDGAGKPVTAAVLKAVGPMAALLAEAMLPNLVQTAEGAPALVHGGPFANLAHGCSSVLATQSALGMGEVVLTEAGFGFELGGEKFFHLKCRASGLWPHGVVLVVTLRAVREHGLSNVDHQVAAVRAFGFEPVLALNVFDNDAEEELRGLERACEARGLRNARVHAFGGGGAGAEQLARVLLDALPRATSEPKFLYALEDPLETKLSRIAQTMYGVEQAVLAPQARKDLETLAAVGWEKLPLCVAKTPHALHDGEGGLVVRSLRVWAGAGFLQALAGDIVTLPGLPRSPAAHHIDLTDGGDIVGLH